MTFRGIRQTVKQTHIGLYSSPELEDFRFSKAITFSGGFVEDTNYPVMLKIYPGQGQDLNTGSIYLNSSAQPLLQDLRFVDANMQECDYWLETNVNDVAATITANGGYINCWVELPRIPTTGTTISMLWGHPTAASKSNGNATFDFFDDFLGNALDTTKWDIGGTTPTVSVSGGIASITPSTTALQGIQSKSTFNSYYSYRARCAPSAVTAGKYPTFGFVTSANGHQADSQYNFDTNAQIFYKFVGTEADYLDSTIASGLVTANNYHITEIKRAGPYVLGGWVDDAYYKSASNITKVPSDSLPAAIMSYGTTTAALCDWALVRKYQSPEPTPVAVTTKSIR